MLIKATLLCRPPPPLEPRRPPLPVRNEFASSSEDDDDLSVDGNNVSWFFSLLSLSVLVCVCDMLAMGMFCSESENGYVLCRKGNAKQNKKTKNAPLSYLAFADFFMRSEFV